VYILGAMLEIPLGCFRFESYARVGWNRNPVKLTFAGDDKLLLNCIVTMLMIENVW